MEDVKMKCTFCQTQGELHQVESPALRLCSDCREKLGNHIAVVCTHCNTLHWLPKNGHNVQMASEMSGLPLDHIMDNYIVHEIKKCRQCYDVIKDFTKEVRWVQ